MSNSSHSPERPERHVRFVEDLPADPLAPAPKPSPYQSKFLEDVSLEDPYHTFVSPRSYNPKSSGFPYITIPKRVRQAFSTNRDSESNFPQSRMTEAIPPENIPLRVVSPRPYEPEQTRSPYITRPQRVRQTFSTNHDVEPNWPRSADQRRRVKELRAQFDMIDDPYGMRCVFGNQWRFWWFVQTIVMMAMICALTYYVIMYTTGKRHWKEGCANKLILNPGSKDS